jgi:NAD(P)H dehydrogenase (quinone)
MENNAMNILIVYDSKTGNTEKLAKVIAKGAKETGADVKVSVKRAELTTNQDLLNADGIVMGSPTYFGQMSSKLKHIIDDSIEVHERLQGKVGAAFTSSGGTASGAETTLLSIVQVMLIHGMIVQGNAEEKHYGVACQGAPKAEDLKACQELDARVAFLIQKLKA